MKNLTLSVEDQVLQRARTVARSLGKSVNQLVREYLERLTSQDDARRDVEELERLSEQAGGHSRGWKFNRDELHDRS
ncbi:MAG: DUF6364 family protein [Gemmatimonadota bacterium]